MVRREAGLAGLFVLLGAAWASAATLPTTAKTGPRLGPRTLPMVQRADVRQVLEKPILSAQGPVETFVGSPDHYQLFLDHPDRGVIAWRRLGAQCVSITECGEGQFSWNDDFGSSVVWETVYKSPSQRVWYAQGKVRPGPLLPLVPLRVVVVLNHQEVGSREGGALMKHQAEVFLGTDSKTAAVITRLAGNSAQRIAEQGLGQLQLFFSGLSWYLHRHPEEAEKLLRQEK